MCAKKDSSLATGALVRDKNSYTHEKPKVSLQFGQVIITILLFLLLTMTWLRDNLIIAPTMLETVLILIVEILRTDIKGWHLTRKIRTVKLMLI